jgi:putative FmdB family regulatory protein
MPTYQYECKNCTHSFETFQSMSDSPLTICPECGSEIRRIIFGGAGVIFKGSGFYVTDKNKSTVAASGNKSAKTDNTKIDKKTASDAKPQTGESAPAQASSPCGNCPNKGASPSCTA